MSGWGGTVVRGRLRQLRRCALALTFVAGAFSSMAAAQTPCGPGQPPITNPGATGHPHPQPTPATPCQTVENGVVVVRTGDSLFPQSLPFTDPPGTNLLPTIYTNLYDSAGAEVPNTLPSTPTVPYNLHDGEPVVTSINPTSPDDDLRQVLATAARLLAGRPGSDRPDGPDAGELRRALRLGIDVLEGNPVANRVYSGFPLLHYTGPLKLKKVVPILDAAGKVVGGNVDIHQLWYDGRIESDANMIDPSAVYDVPWTISYRIDVLNRGEDDFSPWLGLVDVPATAAAGVNRTWLHDHDGDPATPAAPSLPLAGMDQSFFPMQDGTRTSLRMKMPPGRYYNMVYTWGWRMHPPRIQVIENALKSVGGTKLHDFEVQVFGENPRANEEAKLAAIAKIGDLAPAKRMWKALRAASAAADRGDWEAARRQLPEAREAFDDWRERTELPRGVEADPDSDITLLYVNNTIYGQLTAGTITNWPAWQTRGSTFKVTLLNGDYFDHGYMSVDFGGSRGWENQFKSSVKFGGSGCWFTFGRNYYYLNLASPVIVSGASPKAPWTPIKQKVHIQMSFDPSRRLRVYQFDPLHHDVAIFSIH
jgi:hypothetical protein